MSIEYSCDICKKCKTKMKLMQEFCYGAKDLPLGNPYLECPKCGKGDDYMKIIYTVGILVLVLFGIINIIGAWINWGSII